MKHAISLIALIAASPALAEDSRELDAHEHGVGTLNIAVDGTTVAMEFQAPGADIVGFEYAAESDDDLAEIETALETLASPLDLFVLPEAAGCTVDMAEAELEGDDHEDDHKDHDDDHGDHDAHEGEDHNDHKDEDHDDHAHDDHDDHADQAGHTEFHAEYSLTCTNPDALNSITFAYFDAFPNALEVEVQTITATGANAYEVERDAPVLNLEG